MLLTPPERDKFVVYLEQEASNNKQLIEQIEKLPGPLSNMTQILKQDAAAYAYVAAKLRAVEDETIGGIAESAKGE